MSDHTHGSRQRLHSSAERCCIVARCGRPRPCTADRAQRSACEHIDAHSAHNSSSSGSGTPSAAPAAADKKRAHSTSQLVNHAQLKDVHGRRWALHAAVVAPAPLTRLPLSARWRRTCLPGPPRRCSCCGRSAKRSGQQRTQMPPPPPHAIAPSACRCSARSDIVACSLACGGRITSDALALPNASLCVTNCAPCLLTLLDVHCTGLHDPRRVLSRCAAV